MPVLNRDIIVLIKIIASCATAALLIFFISALSGEDLIRNNGTIRDLDSLLADISSQLNDGIDQRIKQLGEVPAINPYRKFYCAELAKEIHQIAYLSEKQRMMFDVYSVRDFEGKSRRLVQYSEQGDVNGLMDELDIVKRELKNSANLLDKMRGKLVRQRAAYIILFFALWIALYIYYGRGILK
jgi:hypothetical protein